MFMIDLAENYAALWIAIQYGFENAETSFRYLDNALEDPFRRRTKSRRIYDGETKTTARDRNLTADDVRNMMRLREERVTYKDIGMMYGMTDQAVYQQIKRFKNGSNVSRSKKGIIN
ncbi:MAG: hypothetical protein K0R93_1022 [Anaerosolibacter sp.]|uniref:hypothetical protein n=1 Tax=Anaerosolibacter sp. TaxID=1872527 RepID=UPI002630E509|nr:hypothetical protein [Anaerosolibacter sp.]MDF2546124.1 hypothetical protein [Anaerosolibacter sp.]